MKYETHSPATETFAAAHSSRTASTFAHASTKPCALSRLRPAHSSARGRRRPFFINGNTIPGDTVFGVNLYALHHDERYFPSPFASCPPNPFASCPNGGWVHTHLELRAKRCRQLSHLFPSDTGVLLGTRWLI
ncbi:hypothetical protein GGR57DRAFT_341855 [Xylariaceae sp. FL1272]|nr:hypothetical protein GGR57DRAFT_341855 [Xylariaceae sp. FL1272]